MDGAMTGRIPGAGLTTTLTVRVADGSPPSVPDLAPGRPPDAGVPGTSIPRSVTGDFSSRAGSQAAGS
ncbi:hypothetical protein GCM10017752_12400 [Streptomyces roseoviridis]